jgi:pimeloyl-ACP methyl ester carboxylesterase
MDPALLERHRRFEDPRAGISEEFLRPTIGGARTIAVLTRPTGPSRDIGWVVCPSFGEEQAHLYRLEVMTARALAAAGFPALRFHGQGYGDSEGASRDVSLASHLADAADAVAVLREGTGLERVGVVGGLLGGTVAALTADRLGLPLMAMWQPACEGDSYVRSLLRGLTLSRLAGRAAVEGPSSDADEEGLRRRLAETGWLDVNGFVLSAAAAAEIGRTDLGRELTGFRGRGLVVAVTRSGRVDPSLEALVARLQRLGGRAELSVVTDAQAALFGRTRSGGGVDLAYGLEDRIAGTTVEWCLRADGGSA